MILDAMGDEKETFLWEFELEKKHCLFTNSICRAGVSCNSKGITKYPKDD